MSRKSYLDRSRKYTQCESLILIASAWAASYLGYPRVSLVLAMTCVVSIVLHIIRVVERR